MKISTQQLSVLSKGNYITNKITATFESANINLILGKNGAGKSTFLRSLMGFGETAGIVTVGTTPLTEMNTLKKSQVFAWLPTHVDTPFSYSVEDVVMMGRFPRHQGTPRKRDWLVVDKWLYNFDLTALRKRKTNMLSTGELKRTHLARCFASDCPIIVLDEPFSNLDLSSAYKITEIFNEEVELGKNIILSIHDLNLATKFGSNYVFLKSGELYIAGDRDEVFCPTHIKNVFDLELNLFKNDEKTRYEFSPLKSQS